jgi:hypothetical protein
VLWSLFIDIFTLATLCRERKGGGEGRQEVCVNSCEERPKLTIKYSIYDTVQQSREGEGAFTKMERGSYEGSPT